MNDLQGRDIKGQLYALCQEYLDKRIATAQAAIEAAQQAANDETKSNSGDKYETGRAMMQLEVEKNAAQLQEALKLKHMLDAISLDTRQEFAQAGSLVITDHGIFFIAISIGKVMLGSEAYLVISPGSPMGQQLKGLKPGDTLNFRDQRFVIREIL